MTRRALLLMLLLVSPTIGRAQIVSAGPGGTVGADYSAGAPTPPAAAATSWTYSGTTYALLTTVAAGSRSETLCENMTGSVMYVVLDDGAGNGATIFALDPSGYGAGRQGGAQSFTTERGRLRVFGSTASGWVACRQN